MILEWKNIASHSPAADDDRLAVALMLAEDEYVVKVPDIGDYRRKDCRAVIQLPEALQKYGHLYCYFSSATGEDFSESRYFNIQK